MWRDKKGRINSANSINTNIERQHAPWMDGYMSNRPIDLSIFQKTI